MEVGAAAGSAALQTSVKVSEKQEDQKEEVTKTLIESTESSAPREAFGTGTTVNAEA